LVLARLEDARLVLLCFVRAVFLAPLRLVLACLVLARFVLACFLVDLPVLARFALERFVLARLVVLFARLATFRPPVAAAFVLARFVVLACFLLLFTEREPPD
jgi:hypothetical protein